MRALSLSLLISILTLFPGLGNAGSRPPQIAVSESENDQSTNPNHETYRGYYIDRSKIAAQQDFSVVKDGLQHQLDIVESVGLSTRVLTFFHTIPIVVDEAACLDMEAAKDKPPPVAAACYGRITPRHVQDKPRNGSVWDSEKSAWTNPDPVGLAEDTELGVVMVRPNTLASSRQAQRPVLLHELLHAYHNKMMPHGSKNQAILSYYDLAKSNQFYPADAYLMTNEREFFAVTASVFLYGKDGPFTRANLKEKQPDYFNYLVWLFGFDPDRTPGSSPTASAY